MTNPIAHNYQTEDIADAVSKAMRKAWQLGQTYWQQADSDFISNHKKADATEEKFKQLVEDTRAQLIAQRSEPPADTQQQG